MNDSKFFSKLSKFLDLEEDKSEKTVLKKQKDAKRRYPTAKEIQEQLDLEGNQQPDILNKVGSEKRISLDKDKTWTDRPTTFKPLIHKKLTIILLENTNLVNDQLVTVSKIINNLGNEELMCIINYGSIVKVGEIQNVSFGNGRNLLNETDIGEKACLFDALVELEKFANEKYLSIEENIKEQVMIKTIEIVGIGTCTDNGSINLKETGINSFYRLTSKPQLLTKYFCLTEENLARAAEIGFRSIGVMFKNF